MDKLPLIIIAGPTASGKTKLAVKLAKKYNGEIISADSRAIFKGIDIASAKPGIDEREGVRHWGFDLVEPGQVFTAADFKKYAYKKIDDIHRRGKVPFLVGGTGLYIDAVLYNYNFAKVPINEEREFLNSLSLEQLYEYCKKYNVKLPENSKNKRYVIRAIEKSSQGSEVLRSKKYNEYYNIVVGITTKRDILRERINKRNEQFISSGIVEEALALADKYGWQSEAMTANAYPLIRQYLSGKLSESELVQKMTTTDWRLAKRQITFMKRNQDMKWLDLAKAEEFLNNKIKKLSSIG